MAFHIPVDFVDAFFEGMKMGFTSFDASKTSPKECFDFIETEHLKAKLALKGLTVSRAEQPNPAPETQPAPAEEMQ